MLALATFQLEDVLVVHIEGLCRHSLLPSGECIKLSIALDTVVSTVEELLAEFESANEHQPRVPHIPFTNVTALLLEPIALLFNEFLTFLSSALIPKLNKVVSGTMSVNCLGCQVYTTLQIVQSLGATDPPVVAATEHLTVKHIANTFQLRDLLS